MKFCSKKCRQKWNIERESFGSTTRIFAFALLKLKEIDRETFRKVHKAVSREMSVKDAERLDKRLAKFKVRINLNNP